MTTCISQFVLGDVERPNSGVDAFPAPDLFSLTISIMLLFRGRPTYIPQNNIHPLISPDSGPELSKTRSDSLKLVGACLVRNNCSCGLGFESRLARNFRLRGAVLITRLYVVKSRRSSRKPLSLAPNVTNIVALLCHIEYALP